MYKLKHVHMYTLLLTLNAATADVVAPEEDMAAAFQATVSNKPTTSAGRTKQHIPEIADAAEFRPDAGTYSFPFFAA